MSASGPSPRRGRRIDPDALPDPTLWGSHRSEERRATVRLVLYAAVAVAIVGGALALQATLRRASAVSATAPALVERLPREGLAWGASEPARREAPPVSPEELAALQKSWLGSQSYAPRGDGVDEASGERVAPFHGFGLQIDSTPSQARVVVNGEDMGTTPLLTTVACEAGDDVEVILERGGARGRTTTRCRKDLLVKLQVRLSPPR
jgi:hypothetical protein